MLGFFFVKNSKLENIGSELQQHRRHYYFASYHLTYREKVCMIFELRKII